jgi:ribulose-phosphate 3-epimerase
MKNTIIAPSVLAADFGNLQRDIEMINAKPTGSISTSWTAFLFRTSLRNACFEAINKHANTIDAFDDRPLHQNFR